MLPKSNSLNHFSLTHLCQSVASVQSVILAQRSVRHRSHAHTQGQRSNNLNKIRKMNYATQHQDAKTPWIKNYFPHLFLASWRHGVMAI
jgi:hypothetical protein